MLNQLRPAVVMLICLAAITGVIYPLAVTGLAQLAFPGQANGSLIVKDGAVIGSALIGQAFTADKYFQGRPSATAETPYNAGASGGSNAGPAAKGMIERVGGDVTRLKAENPNVAVPVDLVTTSASGLDPHITPAGALFQVPRVAKARGLSESSLRDLVDRHVEGRFLGILGEPRVNVLALNLALDALQK
jgi:K+-transporting ATPase ATPase C chain